MLKMILRTAGLLLIFSLIVWQISTYADDHRSAQTSNDSTLPKVRVGVLVSGSVHWQVETLKKNGFDKQNGINVNVVPLGSVNALLVALQGDAVDFIVSDWVWVAKQRNKGRHFMFYPFSTVLGGVVAPTSKNFVNVGDLLAKKVGVAGGPEGKSWLLLTAYAKKKFNIDLEKRSTIKFVAPPLVNALLDSQKLDAGLNYWHFNAVLDKSRYKELLSGQDILSAFGVVDKVPMLGWVFQEKWAKQNSNIVDKFLAAINLAGQQLKNSDEAWAAIEYLLKTEQKKYSLVLRDEFRTGIVQEFGQLDVENMAAIFTVLEKSRVNDNVSKSSTPLPQDIFWRVKGDQGG